MRANLVFTIPPVPVNDYRYYWFSVLVELVVITTQHSRKGWGPRRSETTFVSGWGHHPRMRQMLIFLLVSTEKTILYPSFREGTIIYFVGRGWRLRVAVVVVQYLEWWLDILCLEISIVFAYDKLATNKEVESFSIHFSNSKFKQTFLLPSCHQTIR